MLGLTFGCLKDSFPRKGIERMVEFATLDIVESLWLDLPLFPR